MEVHISSVGGSAFDAITIYDLLKKYPGNVTTYVDALAASAASIVAMGGKTIVMSKYALLMIHKPMVGTGGNADELLKDVQMLNVVQSRLAQIYMDKTGLDGITMNSLINAVTWLSADQALDLGFIDQVEDYTSDITNTAIIKSYITTAPPVYQRCINKILTKKSNMNIENKELIEKTTSVLDKIMNFFKKVVNKQTITDKGTLYYAGDLGEGTEVYQDADMTTPAADDTYTAADGSKIEVQGGQAQTVSPQQTGPDADDDDDTTPSAKFKGTKKPMDVQNKLQQVKAKLHEQNNLLAEAKQALEAANTRLNKTREDVKNEIKSDFMPQSGGLKRGSKAKNRNTALLCPSNHSRPKRG